MPVLPLKMRLTWWVQGKKYGFLKMEVVCFHSAISMYIYLHINTYENINNQKYSYQYTNN